MKRRHVDATYCELTSTYGHDAFLVEVEEQTTLIKHFLDKTFNGYLVVRQLWHLKIFSLDHRIIYSIIEPDSRVLDLGCGEGDLLYPLVRDKHVRAQGIELRR